MTITTHHTPTRNEIAPHRHAGFTLLEMLIAATLFLIVTGAVWGLLEVARGDRFTSTQRAETMQNLRVALNALGRDAWDASYFYPKNGALMPGDSLYTMLSLPYTTGATFDVLTPVISGRCINANTLTGATAGSCTNPAATDQISFVYREDRAVTPGTGSPLTLTIASANNNGDQVTFASGSTNANCRQNDLFIIMGPTASAIGMVTGTPGSDRLQFSSGDPLSINSPALDVGNAPPYTHPNPIRQVLYDANNNFNTNSTMTRISVVTYRVMSDGTLVRTVYGNSVPGRTAATSDQPLAYNIESMQITYILDDGTTTSDPRAGVDGVSGTADDTPQNLKKVRQVSVSLRARSPQKDRRTNQNEVITLSATFNTRNLGYASGL